MRLFIVLMLLNTLIFGYTIDDAKELQYKPITEKTKQKYIYILKTLSKEDNSEAIFMLAQAYEQGLFISKDMKLAIDYYKKSAKLGNNKAKDRLEYLLSDHTKNRDQDHLDDIFLNLTTKIEDRFLDKTVNAVESFGSLISLFEALGYEFDRLDINSKLDTVFSVVLLKTDKRVDKKLVDILVGKNLTKEKIARLLESVDRIDVKLKGYGYRVFSVKFAIGLDMYTKISIRKLK